MLHQSVTQDCPTASGNDFEALLADPPGSETRNAAPAGTRNGVAQETKSASHLQNDTYTQPAVESSIGFTLDGLADSIQWVVWGDVTRDDKTTKVPFNPAHPQWGAKANDRTTWGTRSAALKAVPQMKGDGKRGVGLQLGIVDGSDRLRIGGVDLDSCLDPDTGALEPWAAAVIDRLGSYAEVSPSGKGIKVFFTYTSSDTPALVAAMRNPETQKDRHRLAWSRGSHCEIGLDVSNRYYAVTGARWADTPTTFRTVALDDLLWIIRDAGPAFKAGATATDDQRDESGSGYGFRLLREQAERGADREAAFAALKADTGIAGEWAARCGQRQLDRTWTNASDAAAPLELDLSDLEDLAPLEDTPEAPSRLRFLSPGECAEAPSRGYLVKGFLAPRDVACVFGAPGAGKSLLSPLVGYAVARGADVFGMRTKPGRVFFVAAEDPHGMRGRVSALKLRHGDAPDFVLVEGLSDILTPGSDDLRALYGAIKSQRPALVFIDTLAMAFPGLEENSAEAMGRVVAVARKLTDFGAAIVLVHHDAKSGMPTPRGHSLLNGALDVALQLQPRDENGVIRGRLTKNRNGSCDRDIAFRIAVEEMGTDEDGDPITFALADELATGSAPARQRLTPGERAALEVLTDMLHLSGACPVSESDWRARCVDGRTVSAADDIESRKRATRRAFEGLGRKKAVSILNGEAQMPDNGTWPAWSDTDTVDDLEPEPVA